MKARKPFRVSVFQCFCLRCGHLWIARGRREVIKTCPCCRSRNWGDLRIVYPRLQTKGLKKSEFVELKAVDPSCPIRKIKMAKKVNKKEGK